MVSHAYYELQMRLKWNDGAREKVITTDVEIVLQVGSWCHLNVAHDLTRLKFHELAYLSKLIWVEMRKNDSVKSTNGFSRCDYNQVCNRITFKHACGVLWSNVNLQDQALCSGTMFFIRLKTALHLDALRNKPKDSSKVVWFQLDSRLGAVKLGSVELG